MRFYAAYTQPKFQPLLARGVKLKSRIFRILIFGYQIFLSELSLSFSFRMWRSSQLLRM